MIDGEAARHARAEREADDGSFRDADCVEKVDGVSHVMVGFVVVVRLVSHTRSDHVESDAIEMLCMCGDVRGEVFQTARRSVQHNERRFGWVASLNKARL